MEQSFSLHYVTSFSLIKNQLEVDVGILKNNKLFASPKNYSYFLLILLSFQSYFILTINLMLFFITLFRYSVKTSWQCKKFLCEKYSIVPYVQTESCIISTILLNVSNLRAVYRYVGYIYNRFIHSTDIETRLIFCKLLLYLKSKTKMFLYST